MSETSAQETKKKIRLTYIISAIAISCLMIGASMGIMISATTPSIPTVIEPGSMTAPYSYILFKDGLNYYAKNGTTGAMNHSGTDAATVIQKALDSGREVYISGGTWEIDTGANAYGILIRKSNIHLQLANDAVLQLKAGERTTSKATLQIGDGTSHLENIKVEGGLIDGNEAGNPSTVGITGNNEVFIYGPVTDVYLSITIKDSDVTAIWIEGQSTAERAQRIDIKDCYLENIAEGILYRYADYVQITHCEINTVYEQDAIEPALLSEYWTISNNIIRVVNQSAINPFDGSHHGVISDNIMEDIAYGGDSAISMAIGSNSFPVSDILISGNVIRKTGSGSRDGIYMDGRSSSIMIVGNTINETGNHGIQVIDGAQEVNIIGNYITNSEGCGILYRGDNGSITNNILRNNNEGNSAGGSGILLVSCDRVQVTDNVCYNDNAPPTQDYGIYIQGTATNCLVEGNTVYGNADAGMLDEGPASTIVRFNTGYVTENSGAKTVTGSVSTVTVTHGLAWWAGPLTPTMVLVTCNNTGAGDYSVTSINTTQFVISFTNQPGADTWTFYWYVQSW